MTLLSALAQAGQEPQHGGFGTPLFIGVFFLAAMLVLIWWLRR